MNRLLRKFKYTRDLEGKLEASEAELGLFKQLYDDTLNEASRWKTYAEELEDVKGVRDIADLDHPSPSCDRL